MAESVIDKIEYLVLIVATFATHTKVSEVQAYRYLSSYGALALCDKHYGILHPLSEQGAEARAIEDVIPKHETGAVVANKLFTDNECLGQSVRRGLLSIFEAYA